jgi:hypothetical protein
MWQSVMLSNEGRVDEELSRYLRELSPCDLPDHYWVLSPVTFFEAEDLFVVNTESDGFMYVAALNEEALHQIPAHLRKKLERI